MSHHKHNDSSNDDFIFANLNRFIDEDLPANEQEKFASMLDDKRKNLLEKYRHNRGRLQIEFQNLSMTPRNQLKLRTFVEDQAIAANAEAVDISRFERLMLWKRARNHLVFLAVAAALIITGYIYLKPYYSTEEFKAIEYLHFEAMAMEQDSEDRLNFPSSNYDEIRSYLRDYKGLSFKPGLFKSKPDGWIPVGASVIDYEVAKSSVIQFTQRNGDYTDSLFLFTYPGTVRGLPKAESGSLDGFVYRTYTTDELNMIVWESGNGQMSMLVGRLSAPDLAKLGQQVEN